MKITTIAKTSLALGLLTTGVITTTTQAANATTPLSTKVEAPQSKPNATTPPSSNVDTSPPQSPTTKQVPTEINPKFKDLRAYYTKPSIEFKNEIGIILKKWTTIRFMNVVPDYFIYKIALVGKDDKNMVKEYIGMSMYLSF